MSDFFFFFIKDNSQDVPFKASAVNQTGQQVTTSPTLSLPYSDNFSEQTSQLTFHIAWNKVNGMWLRTHHYQLTTVRLHEDWPADLHVAIHLVYHVAVDAVHVE